ncbi:hypothetical protein D6C77_05373 [Aureobasidium pullulans]|nr:hypothetical protein D6C77_05373 [Aureobasidium pullulans]
MAERDSEVLEASTSISTAPASASAKQAPATTRAAQHKRSWSGCARCKKRRQKCDENRPECGRCKAANVECVYEVKLRWGGRAFGQSRFGACISDTTTASKDKKCWDDLSTDEGIGSVDKGFIYTVNSFQVQPQPPRVTAPPAPAVQEAIPVEQFLGKPDLHDLPPLDLDLDDSLALVSTTSPDGIQLDDYDIDFFPLFTPVDPFVNLGTLDRSLLDHFINGTSHVISCHSKVQEDVCRVIVPAALQSPTLFYATAALSAIHHKSRQGFDSNTLRQDPLISRLLTNSLFGLQSDLLEKDVNKSSVLLATIRTLFLCEVHAGGDRPGTWRAHFEGAKALMLDIESWQGYSSKQRDSTRYFLKRWYNMTESFVALTTDGLASGQLARFGHPRTLDGDEEEKVYLDEYAGFATDLTPIFREIGAAAWERRNEIQPTILEEGDLDEEAASLATCIWTRLDEAKIAPPRFRPGVEEQLSSRQKADFLCCNEIWHHMALIYIYRRISNHSAFSPPVQSSVRTILCCIESLTATPGLTPLVVMTTPLFAAGCEAQGEDRDRVRRLLQNMFELLHIPNIHRSLEVLESFWASTERGEAHDWDSFMHDQNWDFLPY